MMEIHYFEWISCNLEYVFDIQVHYSRENQILKRACIFTSLWLIIFLWTILGLKFEGNIKAAFTFINPIYLPPLTWLIYLVYILFPSKKYFNGQSRFFLKLLVIDMFKSPFFDFTFIVPWATDQFLSFAVSLRDFFYSVCYTVQVFSNGNTNNITCSTNYIVKVFDAIMIFMPLVLRMGQCLNRVYFSKTRSDKIKNFINFIKYLLSTITVIISLLIPLASTFFWLWIVFLGMATILSYYWDLKHDFGLLEVTKHKGIVSLL